MIMRICLGRDDGCGTVGGEEVVLSWRLNILGMGRRYEYANARPGLGIRAWAWENA